MRNLDARLARLEARQAATLAGDPVADWLAAFRRGDDVDARNAGAGPAWAAAAAERARLVLETLELYDGDALEYRPHGVV